MSTSFCNREDELLDALGRGYVPDELAGHVGACTACSELQLVAGALLDERVQAFAEAPVPTSATMWWRMQLRHRHEAEATARRSLLIGQAATLLIAMTLIAALFGAHLTGGFLDMLASVRHLSTPLTLMVASWLLLVPIAGYVVVRQK
jgi:hypothetical protein